MPHSTRFARSGQAFYSPDQLREMTPEHLRPASTKPAPDPLVICTLNEGDAGDPCLRCGYPSGSGHAKERK